MPVQARTHHCLCSSGSSVCVSRLHTPMTSRVKLVLRHLHLTSFGPADPPPRSLGEGPFPFRGCDGSMPNGRWSLAQRLGGRGATQTPGSPSQCGERDRLLGKTGSRSRETGTSPPVSTTPLDGGSSNDPPTRWPSQAAATPASGNAAELTSMRWARFEGSCGTLFQRHASFWRTTVTNPRNHYDRTWTDDRF